MKRTTLLGVCLLAAMVAACGDDDNKTPTSPSGGGGTSGTNAAVTLTAPTPDSPSQDQQLDNLRPTLRVNNATSTPSGTRTYEFQISDSEDFSAASAASYAGPFKVVKTQASVAEGANGKTEYAVPDDLQPSTRFYWRARAHQGTTDGPWSTTQSFRTKLQGYNRPQELFDPLTGGETVGGVVGSVTFVPDRGATINTNDSRIQYQLAETVAAGEFSFEAEGIQVNSEGGKTKILSMYNGQGDITTSDYRFTVEKRDEGRVAWRIITGGVDQIETVGDGERIPIGFNGGTTYFWKATWGGGFHLTIQQGGSTGPTIYDFGKGYNGVYNPSPHWAYLGAPIGRAGPDDASTPHVTYRNVFIGSRPRPTSLGNAVVPFNKRNVK